ncbi:MAG TPA: SDR family NAD(P)-dependent oxidoreductase, partial [Fodinibius sp.]|nr:SDR family NAD(P)-dependent oxidoreductase [Fodinibius sp.]
MNLDNRSAIVTGTSRGIGHSIAKALLTEGVTVAGWSRTKPHNFQHDNFHYIEADLTSQDSVEKAFTQTTELLGSNIHILVNNAGAGYKGDFDEMPPEKWHDLFDLNVHGIFYITRLVIPRMKENKSGHIINISSGAGANGIAGMSCYS